MRSVSVLTISNCIVLWLYFQTHRFSTVLHAHKARIPNRLVFAVNAWRPHRTCNKYPGALHQPRHCLHSSLVPFWKVFVPFMCAYLEEPSPKSLTKYIVRNYSPTLLTWTCWVFYHILMSSLQTFNVLRAFGLVQFLRLGRSLGCF